MEISSVLEIEQVQTPRSQSDQKNLTSDSQNLSIQLNQSADNFNQNQSSHTYDSQPNENGEGLNCILVISYTRTM